MQLKILTVAVLALLSYACLEKSFPKPDHLISRDQMIDMLTDIHLAEGIYETSRYTDKDINKFDENDFYYSVLHKYEVADSVFEKSLIYYSGRPKDFEKIYTRVVNRLNEMAEEQNKASQQPVNISNTERR